jgi:protein involved in polysaccharide export with SLBB domain
VREQRIFTVKRAFRILAGSAPLHCTFVLTIILATFAGAASGHQQTQQQAQQSPAESPSLSADEIIQILQENPDLLAEAKAEIVVKLTERGYAVRETDVTDDRLFSEIRSDDRVRLALSTELKKRGYGNDEIPAEEQATPKGAPETGAPSQPKVPADKESAVPRGKKGRERGDSQKYYPYRNLPALRDLYTQATVEPENLERFGASLFRNSPAPSDKSLVDVPVGPDYVVGPGDELVVEYWGSASQRLQLTVDREGRIVLQEAGALLVAGRNLAECQQLIQKALTRIYRNVSVAVSLGKLRMIRVFVVGDVKNPGAYEISSLSTVLSAVLVAGGPTDSGSLRTVRHFRGKKLVEEIDLYDLMLKGVNNVEERFESGDSILIPPIGPQVTVAGIVRRPAIYELRNEGTLGRVLELAGGVPVTGELETIKVERVEAHERKEMLSLDLPVTGDLKAIEEIFIKFPVKDGDRITVSPILSFETSTVYLQGHVFRPGAYAFQVGMNVGDLIRSFADLMPEPADRAEIVRLHPPDNRPYVLGFNLRDVLEKRATPPELHAFDTVRIYGRYEADAPKVSIYGDVLRPGEYPLSEQMTAADLVRLAGGFKRSAFTESADLTSYDVINSDHVELEHRLIPIGQAVAGEADTDVRLKPGDSLTISQLGRWRDIGSAIAVSGEVLHPGRYGIQEGERLSSILKRAGGFIGEAYPNGTVLERGQVREISARNRDELVQKLQAQVVEGTARTESPIITRQRQQLIERLKQIHPSGRLVIHITREIAKWENTNADVEVRAGDALMIPKKPNFVLVAGQVYGPSAITYIPNRDAGWYLRQAGGPSKAADRKQIFVVRANGSVIGRGSTEWWSGDVLATVLQPGDTVYVPEKITGPDKLKIFAEMAQILSGMAIAARVAFSF